MKAITISHEAYNRKREEEMDDYFDKYMEVMKEHIDALNKLNERTNKHTSTIMLQIDIIDAETDYLLPIRAFVFPRKAIGKFMRAIHKAEARKRGRDLVIENKVKVFG
jgi:esterase/lipase